MNRLLLSTCTIALLAANALNSSTIEQKLAPYKNFLENGTYDGQDWSSFSRKPLSRYHTFLKAFEHFTDHNGKIVVELGTTRSFTHGGLPGCNRDETYFWTPNNPENWDWGAGSFTRIAAEILCSLNPIIHTVDLASAHIKRCQLITAEFSSIMRYHVCSSLDFLRSWNTTQKIDLIYMDTGDMTPIEPTARLHLAEAQIIVERNLLSSNGIILIDDVRNQTPKKFGDQTGLGKDKYSIPYLITHGFEIVEDEYQVILKKRS